MELDPRRLTERIGVAEAAIDALVLSNEIRPYLQAGSCSAPARGRCLKVWPETTQSGRELIQKFAQLGRGLELRDRIELLERVGQCIGQTSHRTRREFLVLRLKIQPVYLGQ